MDSRVAQTRSDYVSSGLNDINQFTLSIFHQLSNHMMSLTKPVYLSTKSRKKRPPAFFLLHSNRPPRNWTIAFTESKFFEYFIFLVVVFNCVVIAMDVPMPSGDKSSINTLVELFEKVLLAIYMFEALLKMIAQGVILHRGSYFRSPWNVIDFFVLVIGIIPLFTSSPSSGLKGLRIVRVLRPLRLVTGNKSMQVVLMSVVRATVPLLKILTLVGLVILVYAIIGLEFFGGRFHSICMNVTTGKEYLQNDGKVVPCDIRLDMKSTYFVYGQNCSNGYTCQNGWEGPVEGLMTYDNLFSSLITVFRIITMEGWSDLMEQTMQVADEKGYLYSLYFISMIIIGSFFTINLVLGVLNGQFAKERLRVEQKVNFDRLRNKQKMERVCEGYIQWIQLGEEALLREASSLVDNIQIMFCNPAIMLATEDTHRINLQGSRSRLKRFLAMELKMRLRLRQILRHEITLAAILFVVLLNTISKASLFYNQPHLLTQVQENAEIVFLSLFVLEIVLKIYAFGPAIYFRSKFNIFDTLTICLSILEKAINFNVGFAIMRCLRLLRFFKFTKYWSPLHNLITSLMNGSKAIVSLFFLVGLFIVVNGLLGLQIFGSRFPDTSRTNFDSIVDSMLAVFQVMTIEGWGDVMASGSLGFNPMIARYASCLYFIGVLIIGNYTLLNVFLAIAVDNLTNAQILTWDEEEDKAPSKSVLSKLMERNRVIQRFVFRMQTRLQSQKEASLTCPDVVLLPNPSNSTSLTGTAAATNGASQTHGDAIELDLVYNTKSNIVTPVAATASPQVAEEDIVKQIHLKGLLNVIKGSAESGGVEHKICGTSLFFLSRNNWFRMVCSRIVYSWIYDKLMIILIIISSVTLAIEDPVNDNAHINHIVQYFDYVFAGAFSLEMFLKIIADGFLLHPTAYFRNPWNCMDGTIAICSVTAVTLRNSGSTNLGGLVTFCRVMRVFRPLKVIHHVTKLKLVFNCMLYSLKNVSFLLIIMFCFLLMFACIGVQSLRGKLMFCTDPTKMTRDECNGYYFEYNIDQSSMNSVTPTVKPRVWTKRKFTFDNIGEALLQLFVIITGDEWSAFMQNAIDATDIDRGPIRNNNQSISIFFIVYLLVMMFFFLNIFVALIILTFQEKGEKELFEGVLDKTQRDCIQFAFSARPKVRMVPTEGTVHHMVWKLVESYIFSILVQILIVLNTLSMMIRVYNIDSIYEDEYEYIFGIVNMILTSLLLVELSMKLAAYRKEFFKNPWNIFDVAVLIGSICDIVLTKVQIRNLDSTMFRLCRIGRILRLMQSAPSTRQLLQTFFKSFKSLPYVSVLIVMLFYIYAIIGMQIFGKISFVSDNTGYNDYMNFGDIVSAMRALFRVSTGDAWNEIMVSGFDDAECVEGVKKCGNKVLSALFTCSFVFFTNFLMLNLFVAVVMDNFDYLIEDVSILCPHNLEDFVNAWSELDPLGNGRIHAADLYALMCRLSPPVGFGRNCPKDVAFLRLIRMNMPVDSDRMVCFYATLFTLIRLAMKVEVGGIILQTNTDLMQIIKQIWPKDCARLFKKIEKSTEGASMTVGKIYCCRLLVTRYRAQKALKMKNEVHKEGSVMKRIFGSFRRDNPEVPYKLASPHFMDRKVLSKSPSLLHPDYPSKDTGDTKALSSVWSSMKEPLSSQTKELAETGFTRARANTFDLPPQRVTTPSSQNVLQGPSSADNEQQQMEN